MAAAVGSLLGHPPNTTHQALAPLRAALANEVFQNNYGVAELRKKLVRQLRETKKVNKQMAQLDQMAVD